MSLEHDGPTLSYIEWLRSRLAAMSDEDRFRVLQRDVRGYVLGDMIKWMERDAPPGMVIASVNDLGGSFELKRFLNRRFRHGIDALVTQAAELVDAALHIVETHSAGYSAPHCLDKLRDAAVRTGQHIDVMRARN